MADPSSDGPLEATPYALGPVADDEEQTRHLLVRRWNLTPAAIRTRNRLINGPEPRLKVNQALSPRRLARDINQLKRATDA